MTYLRSLHHLLNGGVRPEPAGNAVSTARLSTALGDKYRAYDSLPPRVRRALSQANVDLCPHNIRDAFNRVLYAAQEAHISGELAVELYLGEFMNAQRGEIERFSELHAARRGGPTPHVAAGATMLTEDTRPPRRQPEKSKVARQSPIEAAAARKRPRPFRR